MKRILIIEDEKLNVDRLRRLVKTIRPQVEIVATLDSVADSVDWFSHNEQPSLALMDIRLSDGLSFEIFEKIKVDCPVIFTTAYDEYAVKAFKYNSVDYILKPVEQEELEKAFDKLDAYNVEKINTTTLDGLLDFFQPKDFRNRFLLPYRDGYKSILVKDIMYFYSELKITRAKLENGLEEILSQTMEELEQQLNPKLFFRANRQYIIHIDAIKHVYNYFNGKLKIELKNNPQVEVVVSREKAHLLKSWLDY